MKTKLQSLMKTLLVAAGLCVEANCAWGQTTLISYSIVSSDNSGTSGSDWTDATGTVTGTPGGTCSFRLDGSKCYTNGTNYRIGGGNGSIKLTLAGDNTFQEGDVVIVRKQSDAESGDIVIALVNGNEAVCKRLQKYAEGLSLISLNPNYEPMTFTKKDIKEKPVRIIGKVIENRQQF